MEMKSSTTANEYDVTTYIALKVSPEDENFFSE